VAELLDHDLPHQLAQAVGVEGARRDVDGLGGGARARQGEFGDLALELRHDVLRLLRADAGQAAQEFLVLAGDRVGQLGDRQGQRARRDHRPDVLHGDELLEEFLVELGGEADQHRARLIAGRVIVDDQLELAPLLARSRRDVLDLAEGDGRQEHLVADAPAFEDDSILELAPQSTGQRRDHDDTLIGARRPGARIR
jgi:hypothetical protein